MPLQGLAHMVTEPLQLSGRRRVRRKEALGQPDATHLETEPVLHPSALAPHQLDAATSDVHHQAGLGEALGPKRFTRRLVDEESFFLGREDLDRNPYPAAQALGDLDSVLRAAQSVCGRDADPARTQRASAAQEAAQGARGALLGIARDDALGVEPFAQPAALTQAEQ